MIACVQRVHSAQVTVDDEVIGTIDGGMVVLLGVGRQDTDQDAQWLATKLTHLRIFEDDHGQMNRSLGERSGQMLVISQFTLYGDCRKGRRPSFVRAAPPELAEPLYLEFVECVRRTGITVATGRFQAHMDVALVNDGPVTLIVDSNRPSTGD